MVANWWLDKNLKVNIIVDIADIADNVTDIADSVEDVIKIEALWTFKIKQEVTKLKIITILVTKLWPKLQNYGC